jgi:MSHA biogenesis protein MshQ
MAASASADGGTTWFAVSTAAPGVSTDLDFDGTGKATILLNYQDAGQLTLNATGTAPTGKAMAGSDAFVVAPASFEFSGIPAAPLTAGQAFNATVTAVNACATPATTPNFTGQTVAITSSNPQPGIGNATAINASLTATSGTGSANLTWDEVGTIDLSASLSAYLGSTLSISGAQPGVGRFQPAYFDTAAITGLMPCPAGLACPASNGAQDGFIYSGQPFTVQMIARNLAGGTTANYAGAFAYASTLTTWDALGSTTNENPGPGALANAAIAAADFTAGVATLATPAYTFDAAATAPTDIYLRAADTDGVTSLRTVPADSVEGGVKVVSGRIRLPNGHGSELLPLPLTATVQYYNGTAWVRSDTDAVTALIASDVALAFPAGTASKPNNLAACETAVSIAGISPAFEINLSAPGNGDDGWTNLTLNLGAAAVGNRCTAVGGAGAASTTANRPWLQFPAGTNPAARATFGVYRGNNEFIYLRENY